MNVSKVKNMVEVSGEGFWYWLPANKDGLKLMHDLTGNSQYDHLFGPKKKVVIKVKKS